LPVVSVPMASLANREGAVTAQATTAKTPGRGWWPEGWWKIMDIRIGVLPVFVILAGILTAFITLDKLPTRPGSKTAEDVCTAIALLGVGGFLCGELG